MRASMSVDMLAADKQTHKHTDTLIAIFRHPKRERTTCDILTARLFYYCHSVAVCFTVFLTVSAYLYLAFSAVPFVSQAATALYFEQAKFHRQMITK